MVNALHVIYAHRNHVLRLLVTEIVHLHHDSLRLDHRQETVILI